MVKVRSKVGATQAGFMVGEAAVEGPGVLRDDRCGESPLEGQVMSRQSTQLRGTMESGPGQRDLGSNPTFATYWLWTTYPIFQMWKLRVRQVSTHLAGFCEDLRSYISRVWLAASAQGMAAILWRVLEHEQSSWERVRPSIWGRAREVRCGVYCELFRSVIPWAHKMF